MKRVSLSLVVVCMLVSQADAQRCGRRVITCAPVASTPVVRSSSPTVTTVSQSTAVLEKKIEDLAGRVDALARSSTSSAELRVLSARLAKVEKGMVDKSTVTALIAQLAALQRTAQDLNKPVLTEVSALRNELAQLKLQLFPLPTALPHALEDAVRRAEAFYGSEIPSYRISPSEFTAKDRSDAKWAEDHEKTVYVVDMHVARGKHIAILKAAGANCIWRDSDLDSVFTPKPQKRFRLFFLPKTMHHRPLLTVREYTIALAAGVIDVLPREGLKDDIKVSSRGGDLVFYRD